MKIQICNDIGCFIFIILEWKFSRFAGMTESSIRNEVYVIPRSFSGADPLPFHDTKLMLEGIPCDRRAAFLSAGQWKLMLGKLSHMNTVCVYIHPLGFIINFKVPGSSSTDIFNSFLSVHIEESNMDFPSTLLFITN